MRNRRGKGVGRLRTSGFMSTCAGCRSIVGGRDLDRPAVALSAFLPIKSRTTPHRPASRFARRAPAPSLETRFSTLTFMSTSIQMFHDQNPRSESQRLGALPHLRVGNETKRGSAHEAWESSTSPGMTTQCSADRVKKWA
jgi:hypothetical protein